MENYHAAQLCVCRLCTCGLHNCPGFPGWPPAEELRTPVPFGQPWKMEGVSTVMADYTPKPIYPPVPPRPSPRRWASDKETTHHDHFRLLDSAPASPRPPFHHPNCGGYKHARSIYKSDYHKYPPCPVSLQPTPTLVKGGHICWL